MVIPYAGICAGGGWQQPSLPRSLPRPTENLRRRDPRVRSAQARRSPNSIFCVARPRDVRATVSCGVDLLQRSRLAGYECSAGAEWLKEGK
jgi:hypothetical protein